ncbi:MAG TPA: ATP-binding protein [Patescibacteria group bacterium]|nr:ATP-binding protein [Patescibacteria group bacterium]
MALFFCEPIFTTQKGEIMNNIMMIALTGGPCAGKTTILNMLKEAYRFNIVFVPEVATTLLSGGYPMFDGAAPTPEWQSDFQKAILAEQFRLEDEAMDKARQMPCKMVICDRGVLDGAAYTPGGREAFCTLHGLDEADMIRRYTAVVHLETRAIACPQEYGDQSNVHRYEDVQAALGLDLATFQAWEGHSRHMRLPSAAGLIAKRRTIDSLIDALLRMAHDNRS